MSIEGRPLVVLANPTSGGGKTLKVLPRVEEILAQQRATFRVQRTRSLAHGVEQAMLAVEASEIPVVLSGDGLIGAVGGAMAGSGVPLGIIPTGRGNDLARVLDIPSDPAAALAIIADGHTRQIDVGEANGRRFLGIASVGFESECNRLANESKLIHGNLVYVSSALRVLIRWKPVRFTVRIDEERIRFAGYSVSAANSKAYGGGMFIAPDADLADGEFDVVMIGNVGKLRFLSNLPKVFKGTHTEQEEVRILRGSRLEISASRSLAVYADGECLTDLPVSLRLLKGALSVFAPHPVGI